MDLIIWMTNMPLNFLRTWKTSISWSLNVRLNSPNAVPLEYWTGQVGNDTGDDTSLGAPPWPLHHHHCFIQAFLAHFQGLLRVREATRSFPGPQKALWCFQKAKNLKWFSFSFFFPWGGGLGLFYSPALSPSAQEPGLQLRSSILHYKISNNKCWNYNIMDGQQCAQSIDCRFQFIGFHRYRSSSSESLFTYLRCLEEWFSSFSVQVPFLKMTI